MDRIFIKDLVGLCIIGAHEHERHDKQEVLINLILFCDLSIAAKSDRITDTVDYRKLRNRVIEAVGNSRYSLVEALAERIAEICLEEPKVEQVQVTVEKPMALHFARSAGVEIIRKRG